MSVGHHHLPHQFGVHVRDGRYVTGEKTMAAVCNDTGRCSRDFLRLPCISVCEAGTRRRHQDRRDWEGRLAVASPVTRRPFRSLRRASMYSKGESASTMPMAAPNVSPITRVLSGLAREEVSARLCSQNQPPASSSSTTITTMTTRVRFDMLFPPKMARCRITGDWRPPNGLSSSPLQLRAASEWHDPWRALRSPVSPRQIQSAEPPFGLATLLPRLPCDDVRPGGVHVVGRHHLARQFRVHVRGRHYVTGKKAVAAGFNHAGRAPVIFWGSIRISVREAGASDANARHQRLSPWPYAGGEGRHTEGGS